MGWYFFKIMDVDIISNIKAEIHSWIKKQLNKNNSALIFNIDSFGFVAKSARIPKKS